MTVRVSHLIPLYKSARFHKIIVDNINRLSDARDEVILSDRNGDTDYCDHLRRIYADRGNVRILCQNDDADWVENTAGLVDAAQGRFLRILPHDDSTDADAVAHLVTALEQDPGAAVAYGQIKAINLEGEHLPALDQLQPNEQAQTSRWLVEDIVPMFWTGRFSGAFKGLIRTGIAQRDELRFRATPGLAHSERAWLFALGLAGAYRYVPKIVLTKRYYSDSTHRGWSSSAQSVIDVAQLMQDYARALLPDKRLADYVNKDLGQNAERFANVIATGGGRATYQPADAPDVTDLRNHPLPGHR